MKIIAHRGLWFKKNQQNSFDAILLGLMLCDGIEIDLRMHNNKIVVSHDHLASNQQPVFLEDVLKLYHSFPTKLWALNVKEDGLSTYLVALLKSYPKLKYFCFDMSFPETIIYMKRKLKIATRLSDLEYENKNTSKYSSFYVIDSFKKTFLPRPFFNKNVMIISEELHGRKFKRYKTSSPAYLCTDRALDLC